MSERFNLLKVFYARFFFFFFFFIFLCETFFLSLFSTANIISLCHGMAIGWLSPNLPKLQSDDSPIRSGPLTLYEASWIGSCFSIGAILGNCVFGVVSNYIGRKNTLCILALPNLVNRFMSALHILLHPNLSAFYHCEFAFISVYFLCFVCFICFVCDNGSCIIVNKHIKFHCNMW